MSAKSSFVRSPMYCISLLTRQIRAMPRILTLCLLLTGCASDPGTRCWSYTQTHVRTFPGSPVSVHHDEIVVVCPRIEREALAGKE